MSDAEWSRLARWFRNLNNGRKWHILVDTLGSLLVVVVTAASAKIRDDARQVLMVLAGQWTRLRLIWADGTYDGELIQ